VKKREDGKEKRLSLISIPISSDVEKKEDGKEKRLSLISTPISLRKTR
jgi:hypothetical protein